MGVVPTLGRLPPLEVSQLFLPVFAKAVISDKEPVAFKSGYAAYFRKGTGELAAKENQQSSLKANVMGKLFHQHIRSRVWGLLEATLLDIQCGGLPGRSCENAVHLLRCVDAASAHLRLSTGHVSLNL